LLDRGLAAVAFDWSSVKFGARQVERSWIQWRYLFC
jgi:hypothetical protein